MAHGKEVMIMANHARYYEAVVLVLFLILILALA